MVRVTDQYFWNSVFGLFFSLLVVMGAIILSTEARVLWTELTLIDYGLMTLATWRLTHLFVYDNITRCIREQWYDVKKVGRGRVLEKPKTGPRRTLADLFGCPYCVGMWMAATVVFFYLLTEWAVFPVTLLAIAAVATFLQVLSNLVGNQAEHVKRTLE